MRRFFVGLCFILFPSFVNAQSNIDVLHYQYTIQLNDNNDTIYGQTEIAIKFLQAVTSFAIDLASQNKQGKGMKVDSVISIGPDIKSYTALNDKINITLSERTPINDSLIFIINYHGAPADGLIISKNKYGERTFFSDNWPNRAHNWIPCIDDPADKASFEFIITAPSHYRVISNGILTEEINLADNKKLTHWKEEIPLPTKIMAIGIADFAVKQFPDSPENIPVSAWVYRRDSTNGFNDYSAAPAILRFLSGYIGPYPYKKLANVESKTIFGGMENASAIFYSEGTVTGKSENESLIAHEITHQWFGDMATEKNFAHLWLSEGFATYFAHIYIESKYGTDSLNKEMQKDRDEVIEFAKAWNKPVVDSVSSYMQLLNINSYQKGSWILHMLRRRLGDSVFHQIIRSYYDIYKGKNADTKDFEKIAEKISGKNLSDFFQQWLYTPGIPQLSIQWHYNKKANELSVTVTQSQKRIFQFPLQLEIESQTQKDKTVTIGISKQKETFKFKVEKKLLHFTIDPFTSLLFDGKITEVK